MGLASCRLMRVRLCDSSTLCKTPGTSMPGCRIGDGLYAVRDGGTVRFYDEGEFLFRVQRFQFPAMMSLFAPEDPSVAQEVAVDD